MSLLETMSLSSIAVIDRMCDNCVTIDFSKASDGTPLIGGMDISQQWQQDGLTIQCGPHFFHSFFRQISKDFRYWKPKRVFKSANAQEFGSPNQSCPGGGGIGVGKGGANGTKGQNCAATW